LYGNETHKCGVVVRDGPFLRYGEIIGLATEECIESYYEIVMFDENGLLRDFLEKETRLISMFAEAMKIRFEYDFKISDIEIVSCRSRALLRIRVDLIDSKWYESLVSWLITAFQYAVEIYE
jgi:hypothetical protein